MYLNLRDAHLFIRVPRTGSTTTLAALHDAGIWHQVGHKHAMAARAREWAGEELWRDLRVFGYIRNPWDWLVSVYNSGVSIGLAKVDPWPGSRIEPADTPGIHPGQRTMMSFPDFVRKRVTTNISWLLGEDGEVIVDDILRFEDMIKTADRHLSAMPHDHYRTWYNDDLADFVARKCRREIEIGGYEF